jgi:hypothetical protein
MGEGSGYLPGAIVKAFARGAGKTPNRWNFNELACELAS